MVNPWQEAASDEAERENDAILAELEEQAGHLAGKSALLIKGFLSSRSGGSQTK